MRIHENGYYDPRMMTGEPLPPKTEKQKAQEKKERAQEKADAEKCLHCTRTDCKTGHCAKFPSYGSEWYLKNRDNKT